MTETCSHVATNVTFDKEGAHTVLDACEHENRDPIDAMFGVCHECTQEIRKRWPRFMGACPTCGANVIVYASTEHYTYGDW